MIRCLGVFRETTNSPNREHDDTLIMKLVTEELSALGAETHLIEPCNIGLVKPQEWDAVIPMCENPPALEVIKSWGDKTLVVNPAESVINCYRIHMTPLLQERDGLHPQTEIRQLKSLPGEPPEFARQGAWLKRGDVHNTCTHDVVFVKRWRDCVKVKEDFATRKIKDVVIQEHIAGDIIKFYGVGPFKWFGWFYHSPQDLGNYVFDKPLLELCAGTAARAVGLEIYGGDAIITPEGRIYIIDINSWPSFARVRDEVKIPIAKHIFQKAAKAAKEKQNENRRPRKTRNSLA